MKGEKRRGRESKSSATFIMDSNYAESRILGYIYMPFLLPSRDKTALL